MDTDTLAAIRLMSEFTERTGIGGQTVSHRYLWTDAFALLNVLELLGKTGERQWREHAVTLIAQVHRVLGRHRPDDPRTVGSAAWTNTKASATLRAAA